MADVQIFEVSLRDGLQNETAVLPTAAKFAHLRRLIAAGCREIEVTSFVRPDRVPALADAAELVSLLPRDTGCSFWALVPNLVGAEKALAAGIRNLCTVVSVSETHNRRNVNRSVADSVENLRRVIHLAVESGVPVRAYLSTVFGCPYEGKQPVDRTVALGLELLDAGASVIALGDTIGTGLPHEVQALVEAFQRRGVAPSQLALHAHDTRGTALANVMAGWQAGVTRFDGSVAGIGGCPYAPGASGNAATEDLVWFFEGMGVRTGVQLPLLAEAGRRMAELLGRPLPGRVHQAMMAEAERRPSSDLAPARPLVAAGCVLR